MDVDSILSDFERLKAACLEMESKKILIGIVGGADSEVVKIALSHEYGVPGKLPERSFIRTSFDQDQEKLGGIIDGAMEKVMQGTLSPDGAAASIGAQSAQLVQNFIDENRVKPPSDFSKKTQQTTLYETGTHIRDRIAYKVVRG